MSKNNKRQKSIKVLAVAALLHTIGWLVQIGFEANLRNNSVASVATLFLIPIGAVAGAAVIYMLFGAFYWRLVRLRWPDASRGLHKVGLGVWTGVVSVVCLQLLVTRPEQSLGYDGASTMFYLISYYSMTCFVALLFSIGTIILGIIEYIKGISTRRSKPTARG